MWALWHHQHIPVPPYVSLWLEEALAAEPLAAPPTEPVPKRSDVVIAGGGFTGLWTAIRLLEQEPRLRVCVVEREYCGYGASGRNGGIADSSWAKFPVMVRLFGQRAAADLAQRVEDGLAELIGFCEGHGIEARIRRRGDFWAASNPAQVGAWEGSLEALDKAGLHPFRLVGREEAEAISGSPRLLGGIWEDHVATLQPALLARGLARVARKLGATVLEGTPLLDFGRRRPLAVRTPRGSIRTDRLVLAMNAWSASLPELRPHLFVTSSDIVATEPVPDLDRFGGLGSGVALADSRRLILYWRSTPEGHVVFGKGGGWMSRRNRVDDRFTGESAFADPHTEQLHWLYPRLAAVPGARSWAGPIDYSVTGLPYLGALARDTPDVLVGVGFSGNGVVPTVLAGRVLASLALGRRDEYSELPLTRRWERRLPPEPFRSWGAPVVKAAVAREERLADRGQVPTLLVDLVAGLDPTAAPTQA